MATLSILRFSTVGGAQAALANVRLLRTNEQLLPLDLAMTSWQPGSRLPEIHGIEPGLPHAPMGSGFWHLLFSALFFLPLAATEAGVPAWPGRWSLADLGIHDAFLATARDRLSPGSSALFLLTGDATVDRVIQLLEELPFTVMSTNLSNRQLEALRTAFNSSTASTPCSDGLVRGSADPQGRIKGA